MIMVGRYIPGASIHIGLAAATQRRVERADDQRVVARLSQKCQRASRQRPLLCNLIVMCSDENDGDVPANAPKMRLHLDAIQAGHLHIQNDAIGLERWKRLDLFDEFRPAGVGFRRHPERAHQPLQCATHRFVIIYDCDEGFFGCHSWSKLSKPLLAGEGCQ